MADFDPDAYLADQVSAKTPAFDPDAHLSERIASAKPKQESHYDPTEGMSTTDKFLAGAGKAFVDTGRGIKQIYDNVAGTQADHDKDQADIKAARERDSALMSTKAGTVGNIAGQAAPLFAGGAGLGAAIAGSALEAGAQPVTDDESRAANTVGGALGGGVGFGVGKLASKVVQPIKSTLSDAAQAAITKLRGEGIPLDLAQQTGSKGAQTLKNVVADNPIVGHSSLPDDQAKAFTKAVLKRVGADSETADQGTMGGVKKSLGQVFDGVAERNPIKFDDQLQHELTQVHAGASGELSPAQMSPINKQIDNILDKAAETGSIDGKAYQNIKSSLDRVSGGSDQALGHWSRQVREALDNGLQRSASPEDMQSLVKARGQYRALKQIEGSIGDDNHISPAKLANSIDTKGNASQTVYGRGDQDLYHLALAGKNVISNTKTPNSGTAQRLAGMALLGGGGAGLEHLKDKDADTGALITAGIGAAAIPKLARFAVENPKAVNFLTKWSKSKVADTAATAVKGAGTAAGFEVGKKQIGN